MKIICEKEKILKALTSVTKAVAIRTTMPILEGILIQTNDNDIKLTCYDLELGIEYIIKDCNITEQGATVVNAIMFSEIIKKLPDTEIKIEVNEKNLLVIECEGSLYKLATMNPEDFPELPEINVENSVSIEQNTFKDMIRKTIFAISTEETRPIFTGCLFEVKSNKLNIVAIDGFRLAWKSKFLQSKTNDFSAVIPGRTLLETNKILNDSFENIKIGISNAIPQKWETRIRADKNALLNCFERISLISASSIEKEKKYPVTLTIDVGKITISCTNQTGDAKEELYLSTEGQNLEVGFNPKYFLEALRAIDDDEIYINLGTSISPCIIQSVEETGDYKYMILPLRLKN